jgi:S-disulfanyl-L-cysteine oxidoreductase SoxD
MRKPELFALLAVTCTAMLVDDAHAQSKTFGVGRAPTADEQRTLGIMVAPDGSGLPVGAGTAKIGKDIYARTCASCHGSTGEGADSPPLVGGRGTLATAKPKKTVGSYWPYATTLWDYVNRAMPFNRPGTLSHDEVYALTAYVLYLNEIVSDTQVIDARTLPRIRMPNRDGFIADPRPEVHP